MGLFRGLLYRHLLQLCRSSLSLDDTDPHSHASLLDRLQMLLQVRFAGMNVKGQVDPEVIAGGLRFAMSLNLGGLVTRRDHERADDVECG